VGSELPDADRFDVLVSTVPAGVAERVRGRGGPRGLVLDVSTRRGRPGAAAVAGRGCRLVTGLDMLLHQAFGSGRAVTGRPGRQGRRWLPRSGAIDRG